MRTIEGFPYVAVQFTKDGAVHSRAEVDDLLRTVESTGATDLLVFGHGWNNTMAEAENLYTDLLRLLRAQLNQGRVPGLGDRRFAALGILWPSKRFAPSELTAGGAAGLAAAVRPADLSAQMDDLAELLDDPDATASIEKAKALLPDLADRRTARREFADLLRGAVSEDGAEDEDATTDLFALPGDEVMDRLARPILTAPAPARSFFAGGPLGAGRNLLNFLTYYKMKERAGTVGAAGAYQVLAEVRDRRPALRMHLAGHSFGARLLTAVTAAGPRDRRVRPSSLVLLQAAFSHYSFAENYEGSRDGTFRGVLTDGLVAGPILITHTRHDVPVGVAYPIASRLRDQVGSGLGDRNDRFGGLGRNGAQKTANVAEDRLLAVGGRYTFSPGRVHNLLADDFIAGHGNVANQQTAYAILSAVAAGQNVRRGTT